MKNITTSTSAYFWALCYLALLLEAGCNVLDPNSTPSINIFAGVPTSISSRYDQSNVVGKIVPRKETYHIITQDLRSNWNGTQTWGQANFWDANGSPLDIGTVIFNKQWPQIPDNMDDWGGPSGGYSYSDTDLSIYTDGVTENTVQILPSNSSYGSATDSLTYSVMPTITNITFNQNISRDSNITVNWTGTSRDFVEVSISCWDSTTGSYDIGGHGYGVDGYFNNTGSVTLPVSPGLVKGPANVELRVYTPKFITLSNGKRVAVVCETCEEITVHIVD